jgi:hypothetical protein
MSCEKYKVALIDSAVTGAEPTPEFRSHLAACTSCAADLAEQCSLIAAIDANLHRQMNAPVPAAILQRLEAHLAQQPQPKRTPRLTQIFAGTLATLATAAIILVFLSHWKIDTLEPNAKPIVTSTHSSSAGEIQVHIGPSSGTPTTVVTGSRNPRHARTGSVLVSAAVSRPEPEVIVPPDERVALDRLIAGLNHRSELASALAKPLLKKSEQPVKHLEIPDIQTAALIIQPISEDTSSLR